MTAISGKVSSVSQIQGSISQGNELVVTRVTTHRYTQGEIQ